MDIDFSRTHSELQPEKWTMSIPNFHYYWFGEIWYDHNFSAFFSAPLNIKKKPNPNKFPWIIVSSRIIRKLIQLKLKLNSNCMRLFTVFNICQLKLNACSNWLVAWFCWTCDFTKAKPQLFIAHHWGHSLILATSA